MQPFWYSETMFLTIGSAKKSHEEHVLFKVLDGNPRKQSNLKRCVFQNKLIPMHWSETMTTVTGDAQVCSAKVEIPVEDGGFHYMSLEPQQIAAEAKDAVTEI